MAGGASRTKRANGRARGRARGGVDVKAASAALVARVACARREEASGGGEENAEGLKGGRPVKSSWRGLPGASSCTENLPAGLFLQN